MFKTLNEVRSALIRKEFILSSLNSRYNVLTIFGKNKNNEILCLYEKNILDIDEQEFDALIQEWLLYFI